MQRLWTYYDFPDLELPNTNNAIEALFSDIKTKLRIHKGLSLKRRKALFQNYYMPTTRINRWRVSIFMRYFGT